MPWEIRKDGDRYCVHKKDGGKQVACHATEAEAKKHMAALYANVPEASKGEVLIHFGAAVKALGDGRVGGYLVQFGSEATKDADGEWFEPDTDFDTEFPARASIYYNHGLDPVVGRRRLAHGTMKADEVGVWVESQLDLADRYQAAIYGMAKAGKLGWSSGSLSHITDPPREQPGGAIKSWPLGHDASLTPIPSDRRNLAIALKSWEPPPLEELMLEGISPHRSCSLNEAIERATDTLEVLNGDLRRHAVKVGRKLSLARRERIIRARDELNAMLDETEPDGLTTAPPPVMGEGVEDEEQTAAPRPTVGPTVGPPATATPLPDLHDLYSQACRQLDGSLLNLSTGSP